MQVRGTIEPVQKDWVVGKALFAVPYVGLLPLHIGEVIVVVIILMGLHELYLRRKEEAATQSRQKKGQRRSGERSVAMTTVQALLSDVLGGYRLTEPDAEFLLSARGRDVWRITAAADEMRERRAGDTVTYVRNQNLHVTNICKNLCGFCGFGRNATDEGAFCHDKEGIQAQARLAYGRNVTEICLLSGVHPGFHPGYVHRYHALDP